MKLDSLMGKGMTYVMLNCDKATYLLSKQEVEKLKCTERLKLQMHLMTCKACKLFADQSRFITQQIQAFSMVDPKSFQLKLTESQKSNLEQLIDDQLSVK